MKLTHNVGDKITCTDYPDEYEVYLTAFLGIEHGDTELWEAKPAYNIEKRIIISVYTGVQKQLH